MEQQGEDYNLSHHLVFHAPGQNQNENDNGNQGHHIPNWQVLNSPEIFVPLSQNNNEQSTKTIPVQDPNRATLSIKGGGRPEEDDYDKSGESDSSLTSYYTSSAPLSDRGRPEPTYGVKDLLHSPIAWSTNEIVLVSLLSLFVLAVLIVAIISEVARRKRVRKRKKVLPAPGKQRRSSTGGVIGDGAMDLWEEAMGYYELDIEDPAYWGGGLGVANERGGITSVRNNGSEVGVGSGGSGGGGVGAPPVTSSKGSVVPKKKLSKDYKLAAMDMFNSRIEPEKLEKNNYGF
mmetsp:Transcript_22326/g.44577  ORF Transcript_22326/g.44577 Transcript_22326/m.44577 type:complete len:289 (-) Transcript_22326:89-955(-)